MFCTKYCLFPARKSGKGTKHVLELGVYFPGASPDLGSIKKSKSCAPESETWSITVIFACGGYNRRARHEFISKGRVEFIFMQHELLEAYRRIIYPRVFCGTMSTLGIVCLASGSDLGKFGIMQMSEIAASRRPTENDNHIHRYPGVSN